MPAEPRWSISWLVTARGPAIRRRDRTSLQHGLGRVDQRVVRPGGRAVCHSGGMDLARPENVDHQLSGRDQIVGNDPAMTSPPECLSAHDCTRFFITQFAQFAYPRFELIAQRIVRVVVKALVLPIGIEARRNVR